MKRHYYLVAFFLFSLSSRLHAVDYKNDKTLILTRVSRWVEVLSRESLKNEQDTGLLQGAFRFDWGMLSDILKLIEENKLVEDSAYSALVREKIFQPNFSLEQQRRWIIELQSKRLRFFGLTQDRLGLTLQSQVQNSLHRIEKNMETYAKESFPSYRWMFLWDSAVEGERLHLQLKIAAPSPWRECLDSAEKKLSGAFIVLAADLLTPSLHQNIKNWMQEADRNQQSLSQNPNAHYAFIWFLFAREGIESMIVLFCVIAGLSSLHRRKVFLGAFGAIICSFLFFFFLKGIVAANPNAGWIRYFVLANVAISMGILLIATNFNFHRFYWSGWIAKLRIQDWSTKTLLLTGFFAIFREGVELSLAMSLIHLENGQESIQKAFLAVLPLWITFAVVLFVLQKKLPLRAILMTSGAFMIFVTIIFAAFATRLLQAFEWVATTPFIDPQKIPQFFLNYFAYNGTREASVAMLATAIVLLYPALKSLRIRYKTIEN